MASSFGIFLGSPGDSLDNDGARAALNAGIYWNLQSLGLGDHADRNVKDAVLCQRIIENLKTMDQITSDVAAAHVSVPSSRHQIAIGELEVERQTISIAPEFLKIKDSPLKRCNLFNHRTPPAAFTWIP